jgi:SAM-dependent methyltransferase
MQWHEDDTFWATFGPTMFTQERWEATPAEIDRLIALASPQPGAAVLDLACGPGRHSLELARRGFTVTGVDRTAAYLDNARSFAAEEGLTVEWVLEDMRAFVRPEAFDAAINLFTAFGYFDDPADNETVAANLCRSLRPGGVLVMELVGKEIIARIFRERDWREEPDGTLLLEERRIDSGWGSIANRWILIHGTERREYRFSHRLYSATELATLLRRAGFSSAEAYGGLDGSPYDDIARRLVIVARK